MARNWSVVAYGQEKTADEISATYKFYSLVYPKGIGNEDFYTRFVNLTIKNDITKIKELLPTANELFLEYLNENNYRRCVNLVVNDIIEMVNNAEITSGHISELKKSIQHNYGRITFNINDELKIARAVMDKAFAQDSKPDSEPLSQNTQEIFEILIGNGHDGSEYITGVMNHLLEKHPELIVECTERNFFLPLHLL